MLLEYLRDYDQTYVLHSAMLPSNEEIGVSEQKYAKQMQYRHQLFSDYPFVRIMFPIHADTVFYCPPPQCNLLFEPVTPKWSSTASSISSFRNPKSLVSTM